MAGVTNAPFRALCRRFGPGLVYVNEMVMATALVHGNAKTSRMMTFGPDEHPRSLQVYGSDPVMMGRAVDRVCGRRARRPHRPQLRLPGGEGDAQGRWRRGAGEARRCSRAIVASTVAAAAPYGVPGHGEVPHRAPRGAPTHLRAGAICADEGVVAIAVHARTVEQHYAGDARWAAIGELKAHVTSIPVLGNGDIWEASDAVRMMQRDRDATGSSSDAAASADRGCSATCSTCSPVVRRRRHVRSAFAPRDGRPRPGPRRPPRRRRR